jgi:hypothetical protein
MGITAQKEAVTPHGRVTSETRQEGYEGTKEEANNLKLDSIEYSSGRSATHTERKTRVTRKEKQSGVREYSIQLLNF